MTTRGAVPAATRWVQGSIIVISAATIAFAVTEIATLDPKPPAETAPTSVTTIQTSFAESSAPVGTDVDPAPSEQPAAVVVPPVVAPAPVQQPVTTEAAAPTAAAEEPATVTYHNCKEVWAAIGRPINSGEPGYDEELDSNHDGVGCEERPR